MPALLRSASCSRSAPRDFFNGQLGHEAQLAGDARHDVEHFL
jgi:hypothetical protein